LSVTEALSCLKRKKLLESQFDQLDGQIFNLEQNIFALDKAVTNKTMIEATVAAKGALDKELKNM